MQRNIPARNDPPYNVNQLFINHENYPDYVSKNDDDKYYDYNNQIEQLCASFTSDMNHVRIRNYDASKAYYMPSHFDYYDDNVKQMLTHDDNNNILLRINELTDVLNYINSINRYVPHNDSYDTENFISTIINRLGRMILIKQCDEYESFLTNTDSDTFIRIINYELNTIRNIHINDMKGLTYSSNASMMEIMNLAYMKGYLDSDKELLKLHYKNDKAKSFIFSLIDNNLYHYSDYDEYKNDYKRVKNSGILKYITEYDYNHDTATCQKVLNYDNSLTHELTQDDYNMIDEAYMDYNKDYNTVTECILQNRNENILNIAIMIDKFFCKLFGIKDSSVMSSNMPLVESGFFEYYNEQEFSISYGIDNYPEEYMLEQLKVFFNMKYGRYKNYPCH